MDKNVGSVDLEELLKARQELNNERGIETDPNMYNDYNPNREAEEKKDAETETSVDSSTLESSYENTTSDSVEESVSEPEESLSEQNSLESEKSTEPKAPSKAEMLVDSGKADDIISELMEEFGENEESGKEEASEIDPEEAKKLEEKADNYIEYIKALESDLTKESVPVENKKEAAPVEDKNLDKYDMFAAFEVKENANYHSEPSLESVIKEDDSVSRTTTIEKLEQELLALNESIKNEQLDEPKNDESSDENEEAIETAVETIDNADELAELLDKLIDDIDNDVGVEKIENKSEENQEEDKPTDIYSALAGVDIEPKFDDEKQEESTSKDIDFDDLKKDMESLNLDSEDSNTEVENSKESELESLENSDDLSEETKAEEDESEAVETNEFDKFNQFMVSDDEKIIEEEKSEDIEEKEESEEDQEKTEIAEEKEEKLDVGIEDIEDILGRKKVEKPTESKEIESYDASKARPTHPRLDNAAYNEDTEIITDYSQLREVLQRELRESELAAQKKVDEEEDTNKYEMIEDFKFINEIATDAFKSSDKFSYILGKDEKGEMVYGNFREHFNLAVFGRNETVVNSFLNSMVLSLSLKNNTEEVNFVMLDSDINSSFEVYNKSSYLYFNRIAKTNKEILDTLIEVTKELDDRYDKIADVGLGNLEQYNDMASETGTQVIPNIVVVFNNYTSASQATYIDKINACLYQILKYGRLVGIYVVLTAKLPIEANQVNYNLSSRLSFKSDKDPKYNVGVESVAGLPDENDAIYFNISKNTTAHIKTATVTDTELDLIIRELEE